MYSMAGKAYCLAHSSILSTYLSVPMMSSRYSSRPVSCGVRDLGFMRDICSTSPCTELASAATELGTSPKTGVEGLDMSTTLPRCAQTLLGMHLSMLDQVCGDGVWNLLSMSVSLSAGQWIFVHITCDGDSFTSNFIDAAKQVVD